MDNTLFCGFAGGPSGNQQEQVVNIKTDSDPVMQNQQMMYGNQQGQFQMFGSAVPPNAQMSAGSSRAQSWDHMSGGGYAAAPAIPYPNQDYNGGSSQSQQAPKSGSKGKLKNKKASGDKVVFDELPQLQYKNFLERIHLEAHLRANTMRIWLFSVQFILFVCVLYFYDPIETIGKAHEFLKLSFHMEEAEGVTDVNGILAYVQVFVEAAYQMSSALVDANTMDTIDASRCFSAETTDVCRLKYWSIPMDDSDQNADNYFNTTNLWLDRLSNLNYHPSIMHCDYPKSSSNCIRAPPTDSLLQRTFGLTPEDPIILDSREDFMYASVVPLAPLIWQTRGKKEPCSGFGDTYNDDILGAGACSPDIQCDPLKVTSFDNTQPNSETGRKQTIYVSYIEPAFICVNRDVQDTESFFDKSWFPWTTYEDLKYGNEIAAAEFGTDMVYWKFISDVAYLQAPYLGKNFVRNDPEAIAQCLAGNVGWTICHGYGDPVNCSDPVKTGPTHQMWHEISYHTLYQCSLHEMWNKPFLDASDPESWPENRRSTFLTFETTTVTIAAFVVSPRIDALPDMQSLVRVKFNFDSSGLVTVEKNVMTTSQTVDSWFVLVYVSVACGAIYMLNAISNRKTTNFPLFIFDLVSSAASMAYALANMIIENSPPYIDEELELAFEKNQQTAYFESFKSIYNYNLTMQTLRSAGFFVVLVLFARLNLYLAVHPRLAVLVQTLKASANDMFHFLIFLGIIMGVFAFLGTWSFGTQKPAYGSFSQSLYQLFRMFNGDAIFEDGFQPDSVLYVVYLILFVTLVFITLLNFLLAIIVNAYTEVQLKVIEQETEQNVVSDLWDSSKSYYLFWKNGWPAPDKVEEYLLQRTKWNEQDLAEVDGDPEKLKDKNQVAITAEELFDNIRFLDPKTETEKKFFKSFRSASAYVEYYAKKLKENGVLVLVEDRETHVQVTMSQEEAEMGKMVDDVADKLYSAGVDVGASAEDILVKIKTRYLQKNANLAIEQ